MRKVANLLSTDAVIARFRAAVAEIYGDRLDRVVLFGSQARAEARPDSDYDMAVFLRDMSDRAEEMNRLADLGMDILYEAGRLIHAVPYDAATYEDRTPLMHEIRAHGIDV